MKKTSLLLVELLFEPVQKVVLGTSKLQVKPLQQVLKSYDK
jgi:hypothetical protein